MYSKLIKYNKIIGISFVFLFILGFGFPVFGDETNVVLESMYLESNEEGCYTNVANISVNPLKPNIVFSGEAGNMGNILNVVASSAVSDLIQPILNINLVTEFVSGKNQILFLEDIFISRDSLVDANSFELNIYTQTLLQDEAGNWDSQFLLPALREVTKASIPLSNGISASILKIISVGSNEKLFTDKPVRLKLPSQAGEKVGVYTGGEFSEIENICENNINPVVNSGEECKISDGEDLFVWTRHLSEFIVYEYQPQVEVVAPIVNSGSSYYAPVVESEDADIDGNGVVDIFDFNILMVNWGSLDNTKADINNDNIVDIFDLNLLFVQWTME